MTDKVWTGRQCPIDPDSCWVDDITGEHVKGPSGERTKVHPIRFVTAYNHNRQYGGPEEGGWWFDTGRALMTLGCFTDAEVETTKERLKLIFGPSFENGNRDISSIGCDGELQIVVEDEPGADYPTERPRYE